MVADPSDADPYVDPVTAVFEQVEAELIEIIAAGLAAGTTQAALRRLLMAKVASYAGQVQQLIGQALTDAFLRGQETAEADAEPKGKRAKPPRTHPVKAVLGRLIRQAPTMALRIHDQANRDVTDAMTAGRYGTRKAAAADLLQKYAAKGIVGFTDSAGRSWDLVSYAEVVTRTTTAQTLVDAHLQRLQGMGKDLVIVSDSPEECALCRPWESKVLSITGRTKTGTIDGHRVVVAGTVAEARAAGVWHPNCFPGDVLVTSPGKVDAADSRWYEGDLVVIHTASGNELPVTPNHPVLTPEGWVAAGSLDVGDSVIRYRDRVERVIDQPGPCDEEIPTPISEVYDSLRQSGAVTTMRVPVSPEQFHGDGLGSDVEVVLSDRLLWDHVDAEVGHGGRDVGLVVGGAGPAPLLSLGAPLQVFGGPLDTADGVVGSDNLSRALLCRHGRPLQSLSLRAGASDDAVALEPTLDGGLSNAELLGDLSLGEPLLVELDALLEPVGALMLGAESAGLTGRPELDAGDLEPLVQTGLADADGGRQLLDALAGSVATDDIVKVERRDFAGHVYNLQTESGWYTAGSIVVHNCKHRVGIFLPGRTRSMGVTADPEGAKLRAQQRARERRVREHKRRVLAAEAAAGKTSPEAKAARAKLRGYQAEFTVWRKANDRKDLSGRTSLKVR